MKQQLIDHVSASIADGSLPPNAGTLIRLFHAETTELEVDTALAIAGTAGVVDEGGGLGRLLDIGVRYLSRQTGSLGGGSSEMARNVIGERVLGFPREYAADRGVPFNQVKLFPRADAKLPDFAEFGAGFMSVRGDLLSGCAAYGGGHTTQGECACPPFT